MPQRERATPDGTAVAPPTSLIRAIIAVQSEVKGITMSGENKFDNYKYAMMEDYVEAIRPLLAKNKLCIVSSVDEVTNLDARVSRKGSNEYVVQCRVTCHLFHESGESMAATGFGQAQDRGDKALYKAITGARKYAIATMFNLATSDDPEGGDQPTDTTAPAPLQSEGRATVRRFIQPIAGDPLPMDDYKQEDISALRRPRPQPTEQQIMQGISDVMPGAPPAPAATTSPPKNSGPVATTVASAVGAKLGEFGYPAIKPNILAVIGALVPEKFANNPNELFTKGSAADQVVVFNAAKALTQQQVDEIMEAVGAKGS
jgi:hypothetical protein